LTVFTGIVDVEVQRYYSLNRLVRGILFVKARVLIFIYLNFAIVSNSAAHRRLSWQLMMVNRGLTNHHFFC